MDSAALKNEVIHEKLRLVGDSGVRDERIEVMNPYTNKVVGTVPKASVADVKKAFKTAAEYKPTLTRHERAEILKKTGEILYSRREQVSDLITAECGLSKKDSMYEAGRSNSVFNLCGRSAPSRRSTIRSTRSRTRSRPRSRPTTAWS